MEWRGFRRQVFLHGFNNFVGVTARGIHKGRVSWTQILELRNKTQSTRPLFPMGGTCTDAVPSTGLTTGLKNVVVAFLGPSYTLTSAITVN